MLAGLAGTAALWPGVVLACWAPSRRSLEAPPGDFRSLLQAPPPAGGCTFLQPPPPLRHRLLLVGRLEMELRRRRLWFAIKVWLPAQLLLQLRCLRWRRARCAYNLTPVSAFPVQPNSGQSVGAFLFAIPTILLSLAFQICPHTCQ